MTKIYSARWVFPVGSDPIEGGAVAVEGGLIVGLGERGELALRYPGADERDFGEAAILPGFVNTHSHLELTAMRGFLEREEGDFRAWLGKLTLARLERMTPDHLYASAAWGAVEAARAGVTTLGDASDAAATTMRALTAVGLRATVFQEAFGPNPAEAHIHFENLREKVFRLREYETELVRVGVSPHAPYTVSAPQLELIAEFARSEGLTLMIHAAESEAESLLLREGRGPFAENLARRGIEWRAPGVSTIQYLDRLGVLGPRTLLAHCVRVDEADMETIKAAGASVAHCPKSNAKLGHGRAPFAQMAERGLTVGLGSDSVASNNNCDMLEEARFALLIARGADPTGRYVSLLSTGLALETITRTGALSLSLSTGVLAEGAPADVVAVGLGAAHQTPLHDPAAALIFASSGRDVLMTVVGGREVFLDGRVLTVDEQELYERVCTIRDELS